MLRYALALLAATLAAAPTLAQQFTIDPSISNGVTNGNSYTGPVVLGGEGASNGSPLNRGAFDGNFGFFYSGSNGLTLIRRTETFPAQNLIRWFDSFTNTGQTAITTTVQFYGNLGSDSRTKTLLADQNGVWVSCNSTNGFNTGTCGERPVVGLVFGNNGLAQASFGDPGPTTTPGYNYDNYYVNYTLTVKPGETVSLLNFAFLASNAAGTNAADEALALNTAAALRANPLTSGLSAAEIARTANFGTYVAPAVPEPATWAMMLLGLFAVAAGLRARRMGRAALA